MTDLNPLTKALGHLLWPNETRAALGQPVRRDDWLATTRWAVSILTVLGTAVQLVVWGMICVISGDLREPWWLWTTVPGAVVIGLLTWMIATRDQLGIDPDEVTRREDDGPVPGPLA
jgi:hypothetical protein